MLPNVATSADIASLRSLIERTELRIKQALAGATIALIGAVAASVTISFQ